MKYRLYYIKCCLFHSVLSLSFGFAIYLFFRDNTYIHRIIGQYLSIPFLGDFDFFGIHFFRYYLVDGLWAYSLTFALSAFINQRTAAVISSLFGIWYEFLQMLHIVNGTFDFIDCIMYLSSSLLAVM